ncbi:MAG: peptide chain release factor N(5)-glutamine methyltransferase [Clostridia bacterium]|nr:peptide chain release factor N(5)-glutamine methyltransferase [Clostridia bacterium]
MSTLKELYDAGADKLNDAFIDDARFDAMQLLLRITHLSSSEYFLKSNENASEEQICEFYSLIERRINGEPLQYIIGEWSFYESEFYVGKGVLIPRPETEELVERVISLIRENGCKTVYDLCSGSGCIGLSISKACPDVHCYLFELYDDALFYLYKNCERMKLQNVSVIKLDILNFSPRDIPKPDIIVSNPPYIGSDEISSLQKEVCLEPHTALDGGVDGLDFYRAITEKWLPLLNNNGFIAVECGEGQTKDIVSLLSASADSYAVNDAYGLDRFVIGKKY